MIKDVILVNLQVYHDVISNTGINLIFLMDKRTRGIFRRDLCQPSKEGLCYQQIDVYSIEVFWTMDLLDSNDYGPQNQKSFSKVSSETIPKTSKRKSSLIETDDRKESVNKSFTDCSNENIFGRYNRYTSKVVFFAEIFDRTTDCLEKSVFGKGIANWIDEKNSVTETYNYSKYS